MSITRVNQQKIQNYVLMIDDLLQILDRLENCGSGATSDEQTAGGGVIIGKIGIADLTVEIGMEYFLYINLFGPPKEGIFDAALLNKARRQMCIDSGESTDNWPCNRCAAPVCNTCGLCSSSSCNFCTCNTVATGCTGATGSTTMQSLCGKHGCICPGCAVGPTGATGPCSICNDTIYPLGWTGSTKWSLITDISGGATGSCSHGSTGSTGATGANVIDTSAHGPCCRSCGPRAPTTCGHCTCHTRISVASYVMALPVYVDPNGNTVILQGGDGYPMDSYTYASTGGFGVSAGAKTTTGGTTTGGVSGRIVDTDVIGSNGNLGVPLN